MSIEGVDYAFPPRPDINGLAAAGIKFACRYGGAGTRPKWLDAAEAQALSAAGIAIVANVEGSKGGLLGGRSVGAQWARAADAHFKACGMPADRPIYLSVDFDVTADQWPKVADALRGAAGVIGHHRVGVYGGRNAILWARRDGVATWFWQTYAWSGGKWVPGNHIEQYHNNVQLAGASLDLNRALTTDYGQWMIGADDMTPEQDAKLNALYQAFILDPPVRVQGSWTLTRPDGRTVPINPLYLAIDHVAEKVEGLAKPQPEPVDVAALLAVLRPELDGVVQRAVREVLGALDEPKTGS